MVDTPLSLSLPRHMLHGWIKKIHDKKNVIIIFTITNTFWFPSVGSSECGYRGHPASVDWTECGYLVTLQVLAVLSVVTLQVLAVLSVVTLQVLAVLSVVTVVILQVLAVLSVVTVVTLQVLAVLGYPASVDSTECGHPASVGCPE